MRISVLGQTEVQLAQGRLEMTSLKPRQIVATLALAAGRPVSFDALVDMLWGDDPPEGLPGTLHAYIAALRKQLEPDRAPRAPARTLVTVGTGYALRTDEDGLDAVRFQRAVVDVNRRLDQPDLLAPPRLRHQDLADAASMLDEALALWRGEAYADLPDLDVVRAERARLEELRVVALEDLSALRLAQGRYAPVTAELESLTASHPLRERLWVLRAQALYAAGRQADALEVLRQVGELLDEELGIEPSALLRDLQVRILRQDPDLVWTDASPEPRRTSDQRAVPPVSPTARPHLPEWPMVGRESQLDALLTALARATSGLPTHAIVTGEPGIGKSRLCAELAAVASDQGARLLVGRCSQDDGAPPLWPWRQVLLGLGRNLEVSAGDQGAAFRTWEAITHRVRDAARNETLVIVLDDLHWADTPTLKTLQLLVETVTGGRLLVLTTWRTHPEPSGALADVADALARAHATRLPLSGLDGVSAADVVAAISGRPRPEQAAELARRSDGNPFYLVEFARLAQDQDLDPSAVTATTPAAVSDVVNRRIHQLPEPAVATLRAASVVGRAFDLATLGAAAGSAPTSEDDLLDHLDRAAAAGLLREDGIGQWTFSHALVRDAAYDGLGPTRAARTHARVAAALDGSTGRETEAARHWRAAGPGHARQSWQASTRAAAVASGLHAHEEASTLLRQALEALDQDAEVDPRDRFDLLMRLGDAERWSGQWTRLQEATEAALDVAEQLDDLELVASAASAMSTGAFWQTTQYGEVHERQVAALRHCLADLPEADSTLRCRVMNALSTELYYRSSHEERGALTVEAIAMARRLQDRSLLVDALLSGYVSSWRPSTAAAREQMAREAMEISLRSGDGAQFVVAATLLAVVLGELGRVEEMWEVEAGARSEAERLRLPYGLVVLDGLVVGWHAMAGRLEESLAANERMTLAHQRIVLFQMEEALLGAAMVSGTWQGDLADLVPGMVAMEELSPLPMSTTLAMTMVRCGQVEQARRHLVQHPVALPEEGDWFTMLLAAAAAEVAAFIEDAELAGRCYAWLAPYAGASVQCGSGVALGPVDAFLAMAAAATGEQELASRHADDAADLMARWDIPRCADWFAGVRRHFSV